MTSKNGVIRIRVAGIALNKNNELLLVNHQKEGRSYWLFPGGGVEYGETLEEALSREFAEELSVKPASIGSLVFVHDTIYPDKKRHILNLYFRVTLKKNAKIRANPELVMKGASFVGMKEFKKLLFYPGIKNAIIRLWKKGFSKSPGYIRTKWKK